MTQVLTRHGYHLEYLYRFKIKTTDKSPCDGVSTQNLIKYCPKFTHSRLQHCMTSNATNIQDSYDVIEICNSPDTINSFKKNVEEIIGKLKDFNVSVT